MKISSSQYREILDYLVEQNWGGNVAVAFPNDSRPVSKDELVCFETSYDAAEYCYEMSTDIDFYEFMGVKTIYRTMSEALKDENLLLTDAGLVDISAMVTARLQRLEKENNNQNNKVMNENNFNYLKDQVKYTGFGDSLEYELRQKINQQLPEFKLIYNNEYGKDKVEATLNFKKSEQGDMYFFNSYNVKLQRENADVLQQNIFVNNKGTITMKEAYNLLSGRSINKDLQTKEGQDYNVWIKYDFKNTDDRGNYKQLQYGKNYGYDIESQLAKHPIKELLNDQYKAELIDSLKKGNLQAATFLKEGQEVKQYIEANPQYKNINIYDANLQRVDAKRSVSQEQNEGKEQSAKNAKASKLDSDSEPEKKESKKRQQRI
ncbi:hypothetical protein ACLI1A_12695 [Flavobacterium sp. RHBU_3]|uniref:hypothetical protein n=1 Tax=Flavobacterium sp. RHBU_3 TaxID=3391184 RepID=UPI003984E158